ncbi:MAG: SpoIIE family protein phosphatase [Clostridia bacterium]|nr:SpoIIE family protein phosphatase [Clostridia bacterium]
MDKNIGKKKESFFSELAKKFSREKEKNGRKKASSVTKAIKAASPPAVMFLLSFASSVSSPALGALPIGPAMLSAAPSLSSALPILAGALAASIRMKSGAAPFSLISVAIIIFRFTLGILGKADVKPFSAGTPRFISSFPGAPKYNRALNSSISFRVCVSLVASLTLGVINTATGTNFWYGVFGAVLGSALCPLICFAYSSLFEPSSNHTMRKAGAGALLYALTLSVSGVSIGGVNVAVVSAIFISLAAGYSFGAADGAMISVFAGLALDAGVFAVFPVCAVCSAAIGTYSVGVSCMVSSLLSVSWTLFANGISAISTTLPEILIGAALYYPVCRFGLVPKDASLPGIKACPPAPDGASKSVGERMRLIADAMMKTSKTLSDLSSRLKNPGGGELRSICSDAFDAECRDCAKRSICHARERFDSGVVISNITSALSEKGKVYVSCLPSTMQRGCPSADSIIDTINYKYSKIVGDALFNDKTSVIASDYANIAKMITGCLEDSEEEASKNSALSAALEEKLRAEGITYESLSVYGKIRPRVFIRGFTVKDLACGSDDLRKMAEDSVGSPLTDPEMSIDYDRLNMYCECRRRFAAKHGSYSVGGREYEVSGDTVRSFTGDGGCFFFVICDGMGSGREAALTAKAAAVFLERMLRAGCPEETALDMLNDFTRERRIECFSTVDILKVDPYSGHAVFFKSGASPSFVLRGGRLFKIECKTAPVGILDRVVAKRVNFDLKEGDIVVMLSDGVFPEEEDSAWLYDILSDRKRFSAPLPEAAKAIAEAGICRASRPDDATVGVIRIDKAA